MNVVEARAPLTHTSRCQSAPTHTANMADWDEENFEPEVTAVEKAAVQDKWEGEDEEDEIKDNWDDEEVKKVEVKKPASEKKKLSEKIKEKENKLKKKQQEPIQIKEEDLSPEDQATEKLRVQKLQEDADLELAQEAFGVSAAASDSATTNNVTGIDAMCPASKKDFTEFEKMLKDKIGQFEKSVYYSDFLDSLFRDLCISLEVEDLKKVSTSLSVLLSEKQKQEKQNKGKKKKAAAKVSLPKMRGDDMDYSEFDGGYTQDYEDFM